MKTLPLLVVLFPLAACIPSAESVRLETSLLDGLSVEAETEDTSSYTSKMTHWREPGSGKLKACLRVISLKDQYMSSAMFFVESSKNSPRVGVRDIHLDEALTSINVIDEGSSRNRIGDLQYLRLADGTQECAYLMQYYGPIGRYEDTSQLLGNTRIEAWYCDDTVSRDEMNTFFASITF